jgi:hypothetical protein
VQVHPRTLRPCSADSAAPRFISNLLKTSLSPALFIFLLMSSRLFSHYISSIQVASHLARSLARIDRFVKLQLNRRVSCEATGVDRAPYLASFSLVEAQGLSVGMDWLKFDMAIEDEKEAISETEMTGCHVTLMKLRRSSHHGCAMNMKPFS